MKELSLYTLSVLIAILLIGFHKNPSVSAAEDNNKNTTKSTAENTTTIAVMASSTTASPNSAATAPLNTESSRNCTSGCSTTVGTTSNSSSTNTNTNNTSGLKPDTENEMTIPGMGGALDMKMIERAFYVVIAVSAIVIIYLGVKTYLVRRKKSKARRYGVLSNERLEMNHVEDEEEDDVFDQSHRRLIS